ncbi:MAG: EamA family transporter [Candidatus Uhrbacteria bacterium]|nr:EamA family transporter [Candidatus Uhrbacteria bacterium]
MQGQAIGLLLLGCLFLSSMQIVKRFILKSGSIKPTRFLAWQMFLAAAMYAGLYLVVWGWRLPSLAPKFWLAVALASAANVIIQYLNAKAATLEQGEVSLMAPLQAMTPGMITLLAITIGELPGLLGWLGILCMAAGSYYIMWPRQKEFWYDRIGPVYRLRLLFRLRTLDPVERGRTIAVCLGLASATCGTFGLLFESLYARRAGSLQGIVLGSLTFSLILGVVFTIPRFFTSKPVEPTNTSKISRRFFLGMTVMGFLWVGHQVCIQPAFLHLLTSYVGTLKRLSIILSVVLGIVLFHEGKDQLKNRLWAAILITLGSILISWDGITNTLTNTFERFGL